MSQSVVLTIDVLFFIRSTTSTTATTTSTTTTTTTTITTVSMNINIGAKVVAVAYCMIM